MADTWEVISGYSATDYVDTMTFEVDAETKKLEKLSGQTLVAGEKNSQYIQIKMPRYWDGIDISEMNIGIIYDLNNSEYFGTTQAISAERTTDSIRFGWVVPEDACAVKGTLLFVIIVKGTDYILKTQIADTPVVKSLNESGDIPEPTKETWYADFQVRIERTLSTAENAVEEAQSVLEQARSFVGSPLVAETAAAMVDTDRIYVYTGSETGYTTGNWYYYNTGTSAWTSGGVYNTVAVDTDTTLTIAGKPADSKKTGDEISQIKEGLNAIIDERIPLDVSDVVNAYPSTTIDSVVTYTSSTKTKTYKKIIEVTQGKTYILNIKNSSSPASTTSRNTVITDANNVVKQVIEITTTSGATFTTKFVAATDGFIDLCVDKNVESVWIQGGIFIDASGRIDNLENDVNTLSKKLVSSVGDVSINLFDSSTLKFYTDFYGTDGSISTGNNDVCVGNLDVSPNTTYTVSCSFGASGLYFRVNELDENGGFVKRSTVNTTGAKRYSITITTTASTKKLQIAPNSYTSSYKGSTENLNVQVQVGDTATDYEPYTKPLIKTVEEMQSDIAEVKTLASEIDGKQDKYLNKNLFVGDLEFYTDFYAPDGTVATGSADVCVGEVEVEPNTEYTISCSFGKNGRILRVNELDASKAFITRSVSKTATESARLSQTITTGNNTKYLQVAPNTYTTQTAGTTNGLELQVEEGDTATAYVIGKSVESEISNIKRDFVTIYIAASNASDESKKHADYVCTGLNDEAVINHVLNQYAEIGCTIKLSEGEFVIDSISKNDDNVMPTAILFMGGRVRTTFNIIGTGIPGVLIADGGTPGSGTFTKFRISSECYSALETNTPVSIFRCRSKKVKFNLENFGIHAPSNSKPITYINGFYSENICLKDLWIWNDDYAQSPIPHENCYGVVGTKGSNLGISYEWSRVDVYGCYEAFRISGEHLILRQCVARFGVYPYTFGVVENIDGACTHPITLINCADECNARMPLFGFNGESRNWGTENGGNQAVTFIDYNMEWGNNYVPAVERQYATELHPGMFKGRIEYTIQAGWGAANSKTIPFWASGSGHGFVSRNQAQNLSGTTSERLSYSNHGAANYMQLYYDTDMNKMVIFDGTKWVDMGGITVDS